MEPNQLGASKIKEEPVNLIWRQIGAKLPNLVTLVVISILRMRLLHSDVFSENNLLKSCSNTFAISHCDFKFENTTARSKRMLKTRVATQLKSHTWSKGPISIATNAPIGSASHHE